MESPILIAIAVLTLIGGADNPKSPAAVKAQRTYEDSIRAADKEHQQSLKSARDEYLKQLKEASDAAAEFCRLLSALPAERAAGRNYRLPTEAEWEYACRSGSMTAFSFGDDESKLDQFAWFADNSGANRLDSKAILVRFDNDFFARKVVANNCRTHAVGRKKANSFGLYDMHGNVYEWCQDKSWTPTGGEVPVPRTAVADPAIRGGSWWVDASRCRSEFRHEFNQAFRNVDIGFRVDRDR